MNSKNKLGEVKETKLLIQFAIPSIISMLVMALYNIVDQFFIGRKIGTLGNAATNIVFPLSTSCIAIALLCGIGGAAAFNLTLGRGDKEKAMHYVGNALSLMTICGVILLGIVELFLPQILNIFGCPKNVYDYAIEYTRVVAIGFPFVIMCSGGSNLIRADGSPTYSMLCNLTGAIVNTILDPIFIYGLNMDMTGAALATIIGQIISAIMVIIYLTRYKTAPLKPSYFIPKAKYLTRIASLGATPCFNQLAMMIVQIVLNKSLTYYGARSSYGEEIPLACAGIISKVNQVYFSFVIGLSQGMQPIISYNYGAKRMSRVRNTYKYAIYTGLVISIIAFIGFMIFPRQITSLFGDASDASGNDIYYSFAVSYFRIFLFGTFINCMQPLTSTFFTAIGKPKKGIFLSLTRQIIFLLPLIIVFPLIWGIDGIMFAGPVADITAAILSIIMYMTERKHLLADTIS